MSEPGQGRWRNGEPTSMARALLAIGAITSLVVLAIRSSGHAASATDFDCSAFLRMHGMLRRVSAVCGFTTYNPVIVDRAHACFDAVGSRGGSGGDAGWGGGVRGIAGHPLP